MKINNKNIFVERIEGDGQLNFMLIHNAGGNRHFFTHQIEMLRRHGNIIQVDLPGHGSSETLENYQMHDLSSLVAHICQKLSLDNLSLIGLNNGADIIIDTAIHHSLPIKHLILIDPPILMETDFINEINHFILALDQPNFNEFVNKLVDNLFIHTGFQNKEIAKSAFNTVNREILQKMFRGLIEWNNDSRNTLKKINFPTLCILTDEHHCSYQKLKVAAPQIEIGKVIGSKCWATLEVPEQVNAMIERFLKLNS